MGQPASLTDEARNAALAGDRRFTPGPWRVDPKAATRVVRGEDDTVAATGCQSDLMDDWRANARLTAAAPELLDALIALVKFAQPFGAFRDDIGQAVETYCKDIIAKAVGDRTDVAQGD